MSQESVHFMRYWAQAQPMIAGFVRSLVPEFQDAEDILQDVAVIVFDKFVTYDDRRPFVAWALGIARREILRKRRSHARSFIMLQPEIIETATELIEERTAELESRSRALRLCLQGIKGRASQVLKLRYEESLKPREIAARLSLAPVTVRSMLSHIRATLQQCIRRKVAAAPE